MKLNNKGFAISVVLYSIVIIILLTLTTILGIYTINVKNKQTQANEVKNELKNYDLAG